MFFNDSFDVTNEDCLYLNVYTPRARHINVFNRRGPGLAVMVWIHGGAFFFGSGSEDLYGPDFLVEHDIVLVTINYRLGIFGFLNLGIDEAPGNVGLKDQVAALKWVKKNIYLFGGNPNRVTIFGESAGSASVQYHLLSDMSKGLFNYAIMQSGSVLSSWAFNKEIKKEAFQVGKFLNCSLDKDNETISLLNCLQSKSSAELRTVQMQVLDSEDLKADMFFTFLPSIEVPGTGQSNFLTSNPVKLLKNGQFTKVPCIIGFNNLEGLILMLAHKVNNSDALNSYNDNFTNLIPARLGLKENDVKFQQVKNEVKKFYFDDKPVSWDSIQSAIDLLGDNLIVTPVHRNIRIMSKFSNDPIYAYEFAVDGNRGPLKNIIINWNPVFNVTGATHFDDIGYLFNLHVLGELAVMEGSVEANTITRMTKLWTNFAKTGNPNGGEGNDEWEPQQTHQDTCFLIENSTMRLQRSPCEQRRMQFWDHIYSTYSSRYE